MSDGVYARGLYSVDEVVNFWMENENQKRSILSEGFDAVGAVVLEDKKENEEQGVYHIVLHLVGIEVAPVAQKPIQQKPVVKTPTTVVCSKQMKKTCDSLKSERKRLDKLIDQQEDAVDYAEKIDCPSLDDMEDYLDDLEDARDQVDDHYDNCKKQISHCDEFK